MGENDSLQFVLNLSKRSGVPVKKILDMLYLLKKRQSIDNVDLLQMVGLSRNVINQIKQGLSEYLVPPSESTSLSEAGVIFVDKLLLENYEATESMYKYLQNSDYQKSLEILQRTKGNMPDTARQYDQFIATRESTARRAALLNFLGDLEGKSIVFLGDDDFTSIATAVLKYASQITVLDIDKRILEQIEKISFHEKLDIKTEFYDARKRLNVSLKGKFDVVFTDPPYTPEGVSLFISRAIELLNTVNKAGRIYICFGTSDKAKERYVPIQRALSEAGLMIRYVLDGFTRYDGAESVGSSSNLYICEVTPRTRMTIEGEFKDEIYTV